MENINDSYLIIDKPSATMFVFNNSKELVATFPVLLGQTKGESPNTADSDSDVAINATTPAGKYKMGEMGITDINKNDSILYHGRIISLLGGGGLAMHVTYPLELQKRTRALNTPTAEDNRMSWGCINISPENFDKFIRPYFAKGDQIIFITSDNPTLCINPVDGKIVEDSKTDYASFYKPSKSQNI